MSILDATDLQKRFGANTALDGLDLTVQEGEVLALLGPTGAGKTTTLRVLSGLIKPDRGTVKLDGELITHTSARARDLAVVFEGFNLLPTLSVYDNIAFPLRSPVYRESEDEVTRKVSQASRDLKIDHLLERPIAQLSGGEKQRVAIARALVRQPRVYLLDEPLSALDLKLREALQDELKQMHSKNGATVVYASHDFPSAAELASRMALIDAGRVLQSGTLNELIADPRHVQVGRLIGSPAMAQFTGQVKDEQFSSDDGLLNVPLPGTAPADAVVLGCWPEDIELADESTDGFHRGTVYATDFRGRDCAIEVHMGEHRFRKAVARKALPQQGDNIGFSLQNRHCFVFEQSTGRRLTQSVKATNGGPAG